MEVSLQNGEAFHLRIIAQEPIAVGGIQKRRTNFAETEKIIPGGAIKGALTASLNRAHGFPATKMLSKKDAGAYQGFEKLVEYFSLIRITHAFPALTGKPRAVRKPLSAVRIIDNQELDVALSSQAFPIQGECAPTYFIDWKEPKQEYFGAAVPEEILMTHTEIDDQSRRSLAGNLFTESYLCPIDSDGRTVEWICNVDFWSIEDPNERKQAALQFSKAIQLYLDGLGRESRQVELSVLEGYAIPAMESKDWNQGDLVLLTLQSDALMLDPQAVRTLEPWQDLYDLYAKFWEEISGQSKSTPCMKLVDFFAHQSFKGGYLYHRYLGAAERKQKPNQYRPYYLTKAGSLFKLQITDTQKARECLTRWAQRGLDLPEWAKQEYGQYERALWQNCPFVRENGYGEVAINLVWHWDHALERSS